MKRILTPVAAILLAATVAGCTQTQQGAVVGGALGATTGALISGDAGGAIIGGVGGAAVGALIGNANEPGKCYYRDRRTGRRYIASC